MKPVVCFGEIMARFSPPERQRFRQAMPGRIETTFAGAEVNVAVAITALGGRAEFVTTLPANPLGEACVAAVRATGVGVEQIVFREDGRLGLYFFEPGVGVRGGQVIYDRDGSSFALASATDYDWKTIFASVGGLHISGIAAGVSAASAAATQSAVLAARAAGLTVSCDLNFRRKLWRWQAGVDPVELSRRTMGALLPHVDVLIGNPFDLAEVIGETFDAATRATTPEGLAQHEWLARRVAARFPQLRFLAMTLRQTHSASTNDFGALLLRVADGAVWTAPQRGGAYAPHTIDEIVDRLGTGDAFTGALLVALDTPELAVPERALEFAVAAGCLAHSVPGDFFCGTRAEVEALANGSASGHVSR